MFQKFIDVFAPKWLHPYLYLARLDKPTGTWLLFLPCLWSISLASENLPNFNMVGLFALGAIVMRGAGCTLNDIADRNFDGKVARTAKRPIPSGEMSLIQAYIFLALQFFLGLFILLQLNKFAVLIGILSIVFILIYPFMKRYTYWPQLFLGLAFNWGALLGWAAVQGNLAMPAYTLYLGGIFWTLGYDTIYAHQDKDDDILIGIKSTALHFGDKTGKWVLCFYLISIFAIAVSGYQIGLGWIFYLVLSLAASQLAWQIIKLDIDDANICSRLFESNRDFGLIVFLGIILGNAI